MMNVCRLGTCCLCAGMAVEDFLLINVISYVFVYIAIFVSKELHILYIMLVIYVML
jgi:hypothetical protein